ncbi:MAG: MASE3 domain-containing protein [Pseudomonadota bacterium]|nr:MASE3 domain-containing protein [Pseudomonadota bacterium]
MVVQPQTLKLNLWPWLVPLVLTTLLIIISRYNFLLFHTLAELFAISVAITMTVVAWNMYPFTKNSYLMFLGIGYFWVATINLFHALTFVGLNIFSFTTPEPTIQLWLAARHVEAIVLVTAPYYLNHKIQRTHSLLIVGAVATLLALFFLKGPLPHMFIEGEGLTPFKVYNEYIIMAVLTIAALLLWQKRRLLEANILQLLLLSIALTICSELAFTFYATIQGVSNLVGHIFKLLSFWLLFLATVRTTLEKPFLAMAKNASTYDAVPDATIVVDNNGIIQQANHAACTLAQRPLPEIIGQHCHALYHPIAARSESCPVCQSIEHGEAAHNLELRGANNTFFDYALASIAINNTPQGMVQTIRNITPRKRAEQRLQESEKYNRMLFESSPTGLALCRMNGELADINMAFANIIGRTTADTMKLSHGEITPEKYKEAELAILEQLSQYGSYGPYEKELIHKDGHLVPVRLNGMLLEREGETYIWSSVEDIAQQKKAQERLDFLAYHDPLTGTPNRLLLNDRLKHALEVANRSGQRVAVMFIDLDRFKNINDSLGHTMGDKLLQHVANRLKLLIREQDTLARVGGDEFVILLENLGHNSDIMAITEKMMTAFEAPLLIDQHNLFISLSIGIALYPKDGKTADSLIKNADTAMYRSKEDGRNTCYLYDVELTDTATEKLSLENALRKALGNNELELHYQPQYELESRRLLGAEALIRWRHPERGLLQPNSFISQAEESGLIIPIGEWVITTACTQMCDWLAAGIRIDTISVNVSGVQFQRGNLLHIVSSALQKSGLAAHHLELEITESTLMSNPAAAIAALHELKALGVMISIDDFGTGYSSLSQLKHLPLDKLKIDQSFIRDIPFDKNDEAIACAIIALGQSLKMRVNAEGIETAEQNSFLLHHGCCEGQGFLYSKAVTGRDFMRLAREDQNRPHQTTT